MCRVQGKPKKLPIVGRNPVRRLVAKQPIPIKNPESRKRMIHTTNVEEKSVEENGMPIRYYVTNINEHRIKNQQLQLRVNWKTGETTWQPLEDVMDCIPFEKYVASLCGKSEKEDAKILKLFRIPDDLPIGSDEDGLCVRRALGLFKNLQFDLEAFRPWITKDEIKEELAKQGYEAVWMDGSISTRYRPVLTFRGNHCRSFLKKRKKLNIKKFQEVWWIRLVPKPEGTRLDSDNRI